MNNFLNEALEKITAQQPKKRTAVWMVGEQLKDILRDEPQYAEIVLQDLENKALSIENCEKEIKKFADSHKNGGSSCVIPSESDRIIRKFYGIPERGAVPAAPKEVSRGNIIDLSAFI